MKAKTLLGALLAIALSHAPVLPAVELSDAQEIVNRANLSAFYTANDGRAEARMMIVDGQGRQQVRQFHLLRQDVIDGGEQNFMVFFSRPSDVRGTVFRVNKQVDNDDNRWLYLPGLDLVKRIAAGDKRTSFVGSHFFYEDVSGRNVNEDQYRLLESSADSYLIEGQPRDRNSVEFTRYQARIDKQTWLPMQVDYFDGGDHPYRRVEVLEVQSVQGYPTVTRSKVSDLRGGGHTLLEFRGIAYDIGLPDSVFSERSLRNPPTQWLTR